MKTIEDYLNEYGTRATRTCYRSGLRTFLDFINGKPIRAGDKASPEEAVKYEKIAAAYMKEKRDRIEDLKLFAAHLASKKVAPHTARNALKGAIGFMRANRVKFDPYDLRRLQARMPKGGSRTIERAVDHDVLRSLLPHMPVHGQALTLVLASSGMRVGEALQLKLGDIDLEKKPSPVTIRGEYTKTGQQRTTFISQEAAGAMKEWLKVREAYIKSAGNRNSALVRAGRSGKRPEDDDRIFPFMDETYAKVWGHALRRSGLMSVDRGTNRRQIHPHGLRKFFRSQGALRAPVDAIEHMMGHAGYLTASYRRLSVEELSPEYLKAEPLLTIGATPAAVRETEERVKAQAVDIDSLRRENQQLRESVDGMKERMATSENVMAQFTAILKAHPELLKKVNPSP